MKTLTIRGVDPELSEALKAEARKNNESLNQTTLKILKKAVGLEKKNIFPRYNDLDSLAGTWSEEDLSEFEKNTRYFEQIDDESWK